MLLNASQASWNTGKTVMKLSVLSSCWHGSKSPLHGLPVTQGPGVLSSHLEFFIISVEKLWKNIWMLQRQSRTIVVSGANKQHVTGTGPPTPKSVVVFFLMCYIPISYASYYGQWRRFLFIFSNDCRRNKKSPRCCQQYPAVILQSQLLRESLLHYQKIHVWSDLSQNVCLEFLCYSHLRLMFMTAFAQP